jgi:hypothetical protein
MERPQLVALNRVLSMKRPDDGVFEGLAFARIVLDPTMLTGTW